MNPSEKAMASSMAVYAPAAARPAQKIPTLHGSRSAQKKRGKVGSNGVLLGICAYLLLPLVLTLFYSLFKQWNDVLPKGFTLEYYAQIFKDSAFVLSLVRTLLISFLPVGLCMMAVLGAVYATIVYPPLQKVVQLLCTIPYALQGVILAISVLSLYTGMPRPFSNRILMLTGTYCVIVLPYLYRGVQNSLNALGARQLIDAARLLGLGPLAAYLRVVVPNILRGIKVSAMLAVALLFGDFVVVNIIGGSYYRTTQMYLYKMMFQSGQLSSAIIMVLFLVTLLISSWVFGRGKKQTGEA